MKIKSRWIKRSVPGFKANHGRKSVASLSSAWIVVFLLASFGLSATKYIKKDDLMNVMPGFAKALGVNCKYCHVKDKSVNIEKIDEYDLKKDLPKMRHQRVARAMIGISRAYNSHNKLNTRCMDCHQGNKEPKKEKVEGGK